MLVGVPKEIKTHEYRVGLTPGGAAVLVRHGHQVLMETQASAGVGFSDEQYTALGAQVAPTASDVFAQAEMVVKVKEPQALEYRQLRPGQILFTYLHLAPDPEQTKGLIAADCVAIAYETVTDSVGGLPLLKPMSEVAGSMSVQAGAHALEKAQGGLGVLLSGVPGVPPARVLVLGGGVVGTNAARMAMGLGAQVTIMDVSLPRLTQLDNDFGPRLMTEVSNAENYSGPQIPDSHLSDKYGDRPARAQAVSMDKAPAPNRSRSVGTAPTRGACLPTDTYRVGAWKGKYPFKFKTQNGAAPSSCVVTEQT